MNLNWLPPGTGILANFRCPLAMLIKLKRTWPKAINRPTQRQQHTQQQIHIHLFLFICMYVPVSVYQCMSVYVCVWRTSCAGVGSNCVAHIALRISTRSTAAAASGNYAIGPHPRPPSLINTHTRANVFAALEFRTKFIHEFQFRFQ